MKYWMYKEEIFDELKKHEEFNEYTMDQCKQDLDVLISWRNLLAIQDTSKVATVEEFKNKQFRYQLSEYSVEIERLTIKLENLFVESASLEPSLLERLKEMRPPALKWVAFQTAGPVLLADLIKQSDGTPSFHNETLRDVLIKASSMKSRWLEKKIKEEIPGVEVIAGLAETILVSFTSAGGSGTREEIIKAINGGFERLTCIKN